MRSSWWNRHATAVVFQLAVTLAVSSNLTACGSKDPANCTYNGDCKSGQYCLSGKCLPTPGASDGGTSCVQQSDCAGGATCVGGSCLTTAPDASTSGVCGSNADCAATPSTPICALPQGVCVQCVLATDCGNPDLTCTANQCQWILGYCATNADCSSPELATTPVCDTQSSTCVQCGLSSDCPTGYDCSSENTCQPADAGTPPAGCSTNSDCTTAADPYCDVNTGMCVACTADIQCGTGSCISNVCTGVGPGGDAGSSERDAGTAERDAGTTAVDAGPSGVDAGRPSRDGGVPADGAVGANCTVSPDSCASGETCEALTPTTNECVAPCSRAGECPGTSICIEGEDCLAPCSTSTDCGRPDFVCDTLDTPSFCIPDCRLQASHFCILGTSCVASTGICTELPCGEQQGATTCPAGDACYLDWACSEGCTTDSDCANGFTCQGGTCSDSYNACSDAAPCDGLLDECVGGSGSTGVCLNECEDDTNCPAGQNCEDLGGTCAQSCGFGQSCPSGTTCQFVTINFTLDCLPP